MARRQLEFPDLGRLSGNAARHRAGTARRTPAGGRLGLDLPLPGNADLRAGARRVGVLPRRRPVAERAGAGADVRLWWRARSAGALASWPGGAGLGLAVGEEKWEWFERAIRAPMPVYASALALMLFCLEIFGVLDAAIPFIYFQF